MTVKIPFQVEGADRMARLLEEVGPKEAHKIARNTVHGVATEGRKLVRAHAPRRTGRLRRAIAVKRRRALLGQAARSDIIARFPRGNHWHFLEFGTVKMRARPFIGPALRVLNGMLPGILKTQFKRKYVAVMNRAKGRR